MIPKKLKKIRERDKKLLSRGLLYHHCRDFFLIITLLLIIAAIGLFFSDYIPSKKDELLSDNLSRIFITLLLAYASHAKAQHIESLKYYSSKYNEFEKEQKSTDPPDNKPLEQTGTTDRDLR